MIVESVTPRSMVQPFPISTLFSMTTFPTEIKRSKFPSNFVQFLGYTIYNAKRYTRDNEPFNEYNLAQAHYQYVSQIPETITDYIQESNRTNVSNDLIAKPIGGSSIIHSHNTFPAMAQALKCPMWKVPEVYASLQNSNPEYLEFLNKMVLNTTEVTMED